MEVFSESFFSKDCPIGHLNSLVSTNIVLPEGPLLSCKECGQMLSVCSKERYNQTMKEFNTSEGTLPNAESASRSFKLHAKRLKLIQKKLKLPVEDIKILDVGCSSGSFLKSARKLQFKIEGFEPAPAAAATARANGFKVYENGLENAEIPRNYFKVLTVFEVIEHLHNPRQFLEQCKSLLVPGGILLINTGNTDSWTQKVLGSMWEYYDMEKHGGHISFFNPYSIRVLAESLGFKVLNIQTRCVKLFEKSEATAGIKYKLLKILNELLNFPAQRFNKGHDMLAILQV